MFASLLTAAAGAGEVGIRQHDVCQQHAALEQLRGDLAAVNGSLRLLAPFGAEIAGVDLVALQRSGHLRHGSGLAASLEHAMAQTGVLIFRDQGRHSGPGAAGVLSGDEQVAISRLFGAGEMHSTHGVHPKSPNEHVFRLSNDQAEGIIGPVGPAAQPRSSRQTRTQDQHAVCIPLRTAAWWRTRTHTHAHARTRTHTHAHANTHVGACAKGAEWHCDGAFKTDVFSHAGYHIVAIPAGSDAGTSFAHLGLVHDLLTDDERALFSRMISVNSNSGVVHPMLHEHPVSKRQTIFLHLAMTAAVAHVGNAGEQTALTSEEMRALFQRVNDLCNVAALHHTYQQGDLVMIDNWAVAHRAREGSFDRTRGLRVVHRTTVKSRFTLPPNPSFGLPNRYSPGLPFPASSERQPVWVEGYVGYRWRPCTPEDLAGNRGLEAVMSQTPCFPSGDRVTEGGWAEGQDEGAVNLGWARHLLALMRQL